MKNLVNNLQDYIIEYIKNKGQNRELLGIQISHYYDGDCICLDATIKFFDEQINRLAKGQVINEYITLLDNDLLYEKKIINNKDQELPNYLDTIDKKVIEIAQELVKQLERVKWNSSSNIADEFYIELCLECD